MEEGGKKEKGRKEGRRLEKRAIHPLANWCTLVKAGPNIRGGWFAEIIKWFNDIIRATV